MAKYQVIFAILGVTRRRRMHAYSVAWLGILLILPALASADTYSPTGYSKYSCSQSQTSVQDPVGKLSLKFKDKKKLLAGKKSWTYGSLDKAIKKLAKSKLISDKKQLKELRKILKVLLECFDTRSLPRPGVTPTPTPPAGTVTFEMVRPILQANCMNCHTARGWELSQAYFLEAGLVRSGEALESPLYRNLRNNPEGLIPGAMPQVGNPLSATQIITIREWINGIAAATPTPSPGQFTCLPSVQVAPSRMKRLSKEQIRRSLYDLAYAGFRDAQRAEWFTYGNTWGERHSIADDYSRLGHFRLDDRVDGPYFESVYRLFEKVVSGLEGGSGMRDLVLGYVSTCTTANYLSEACRNEFLRRFGRLALKHALSEDEYNFYRRPNGSGVSQADYKEILLRILSSPGFLFHLESHGTPVDSTGLLVRISPTEYVSRLAYTVWNSLPDDQLLRYAEDGTVDQNPATVVAYVLDQQAARSREGFKEFFEGWFKVDHSITEIAKYFEVDAEVIPLLEESYGTSELPLIADTSNASNVREALLAYRADAAAEIPEIGSLLTFTQNAAVAELFRTRIAPVRTEASRRNYNLAQAWNGDPQNVPLASEARSGILTRPAFHLLRGLRNRPIIKGRRIREDVLCDPTGLPANNSTPSGVNTGAAEYRNGTTQFRVRALTESAGTSCGGCHQPLLNPLGFALEGFDSLGRRRNGEEIIRDELSSGNPLIRRSYDTTVVPRINRQDTTAVDGAAGLSELIAESDEMHACFTRNMVRFALNRVENEGGDGCIMNELYSDARTRPMKEVLRRFFLSPAYRLRRLNEAFEE